MTDLLSTVAPPDLQEQISEVEREISQRRRVYPRMVSHGSLSQARADRQIEVMQTVLATLRRLHDGG